MLTQIRERATGWLAWVVVILITIPFALWGIQSYFTSPADAPVATVNGEEIPLYAYQRELSERRQAMRRQAGGDISRRELESPQVRSQVLQSMVANRLIIQYVREHRYRPSDEKLKQRIETDSMFLRDGRFDSDLYHNLLRSNGMTPQNYEARVRQGAAIEQLSLSLSESAFATTHEIERLLTLQAQTRAADYVLVTASGFAGEVEISEAAVEAEYAQNAAAFEAPARMKAEYIDLSVDGLAAGIEPSAEEIADMYERTVERHKQAESRKASHILFGIEDSADEEANAAALAQAEKTLAEAQGGADFAALAKAHSTDPGSKDKGGDLGPVLRGQMVAPFEEAVFSMRQGEIRGPVKTQYGYHIIKLTELLSERQKSLDEVREEVTAEVKRERGAALFAELAESFENLVFENPDNLEVAADELGLRVMQTGWFTAAAGEGVAAEARVRDAAFGEEVLQNGVNSAAIELGFERLLALRKAEYEAARTKPLPDVRAGIEQRLKMRETAKKAKARGAEWLATLRDGARDWETLLREEKLEAKALAERRDQVPPGLSALGNAVFAHASPPPGKPALAGVALGNGDYAIYALKEVRAGDLASIDESKRDELRQKLLARDGSGSYRQLLNAISQEADISIDQRQLEESTLAYQ
ncbi:MAG: SurA N-terminal domain-containing protein [Gammaproteobacteria bacterium]